jgi:hypothetical protein
VATVNQSYTILVHGFLVVKEEKRANKNAKNICEHRRSKISRVVVALYEKKNVLHDEFLGIGTAQHIFIMTQTYVISAIVTVDLRYIYYYL